MSHANSIYLVCECGFFYGDMRLHENAGIDCPQCGAKTADAFSSLEDALARSDERNTSPCYICGKHVASEDGWHRKEKDDAQRHWCPEHQPVWSRGSNSQERPA